MLQNVINRFSSNSFAVKGMYLTLIAVLFSFYENSDNMKWKIVILISLVFWILDFYYLSQEIYYRNIFDVVRFLDENEVDFFMEEKHRGKNILRITALIL